MDGAPLALRSAAIVLAAAVIVLLAEVLRLRWRARRLRGQLGRATDELERLERGFARFAPEEIVERVIAGGDAPGGERREVTALFADLVESTALAETVAPAVLLEILNGYFERMSRAITSHQGHLSTLVGDGLLALFGAVRDNPWQSHDACHAALAMRTALAEYNQELRAKDLPALAVGIGLHRGTGVAGLVGSRDLLQFTVVGTTVSVAARLQQLTRGQKVDVLLTGAVRDHLDASFDLEPAGPATLRGISQPVEVWALRGAARAPAAAGAVPAP
jgi:adenylate cyclase